MWLAQPSAPPALWFEALVRVFLADSGWNDDPRAAIESARELADQIQAAGRQVAAEYLDGTAPFPQRAPISGLLFDSCGGAPST